MKNYTFDIDKIVEFLDQYKDSLSTLYTWDAKIDRLVDLTVLTYSELEELNKKNSYNRGIILKQKVNLKLNEFYKVDQKQFDDLCLWIVKDWGGISAANDSNTIELVGKFLRSGKAKFKRIASVSKVASYMHPDKCIIYDSRVAYSLNWILLSRNAGNCFFPIPSSRNAKIAAFDMNVLIRLNNTEHYSPVDIDNKQFISNRDKSIYISKPDAYFELNKLIKEISVRLWDSEKAKMLYYTEMLLFSIADREVFADITQRSSLRIE